MLYLFFGGNIENRFSQMFNLQVEFLFPTKFRFLFRHDYLFSLPICGSEVIYVLLKLEHWRRGMLLQLECRFKLLLLSYVVWLICKIDEKMKKYFVKCSAPLLTFLAPLDGHG